MEIQSFFSKRNLKWGYLLHKKQSFDVRYLEKSLPRFMEHLMYNEVVLL